MLCGNYILSNRSEWTFYFLSSVQFNFTIGEDGIFIFNMNLNSGTSNLDRIIDNIDEVFSKVIPSSINTNDRKIQNFSVAVLGSICLAEKGKIHFLDINAVRII